MTSRWLAADGIYLVPLKTPTLPPATHTNCLVVGEEELVVVDPGAPDPEDQAPLLDLLDGLRADGRRLRAIVLTHHHPDHTGAATALVARYGLPIWAHRRTTEQLEGEQGGELARAVDRLLSDGDTIELGPDSLAVLHTPGHASGHLCLHHARTDAVIAGDLVAAHGTILVNPPDGHMGDYLASLDRIRDLAPRALYPAHGGIITDPVARLQHYIDHRLAREEKVHRALVACGEAATAMDLVPQAYDDAPQAVWPLAARSAQAHLDHLVELGRARRDGARYVTADGPSEN